MNSAYRTDERILKSIIQQNITVKDDSTKVTILIYYRNIKSQQLVMRNNKSPVKNTLSQYNIIYEYKCPYGECKHHPTQNNSYIGYTECTLSRRLSYHLSSGAIQKHNMQDHGKKISRKEIVDNTRMRNRLSDSRRLQILEALIINIEKPYLNRQDTGKIRTLYLFA